MNITKIKIQSIEDAIAQETPLVDGMSPENTTELTDGTFAIIEDATENHQAVVIIILKGEDDNFFMHQVTENNFKGLYQAFTGALMRFEDLKKKR